MSVHNRWLPQAVLDEFIGKVCQVIVTERAVLSVGEKTSDIYRYVSSDPKCDTIKSLKEKFPGYLVVALGPADGITCDVRHDRVQVHVSEDLDGKFKIKSIMIG